MRSRPVESHSGAGRLVLVVDDHHGCAVLRRLLQSMGFRVTCAANGVEALGRLEREPVFLVLTALFMPLMGGIELMIRLKNSDRPIPPVIAVTGDSRAASEAAGGGMAAALGAKAVLLKPFTRDQLAVAIAAVDR
jgi:CheY-like chemotaxis protein